ncbi:MAG TPA: LysR family transcriptional regulator [Myxococcales bacterium]|nr:LysR family transcriptional regulator [Deltaproteobacteria bacterium]MBU53676.1 LysR family transcriptional regulator [Deltaproteobacteria bacterium]HAA56521.1 LysR family transcriptional regulator [Myxococcales bacterium]|tara:strand:+ start:13252 stop:14151 length:900 start_codon:yes stop_codon:yes gene_type:complete
MINNRHLLPSMDNLLCFLAAAEQLNFRKAAKQMALTPAAFGQRIKQLERQFGCALFARTSRSVELTPEGQRLLPVARETILQGLQCADAIHTDSLQPVRLCLGTRFELGISWVTPSIVELEKHHPHLRIDLYFGSGPDILQRMEQRALDCVISSTPKLHASWAAEFLHEETYVFVAAPSLLEETPFYTHEDAARHTLLDVDEHLPLTRYLTSAVGHMEFSEIRYCGAGAVIHILARQGLGVAVLPQYMVQDDLQAGTLCPIFPDETLLSDSFRLIFDRNTLFQSALIEVADFLRGCPLR